LKKFKKDFYGAVSECNLNMEILNNKNNKKKEGRDFWGFLIAITALASFAVGNWTATSSCP